MIFGNFLNDTDLADGGILIMLVGPPCSGKTAMVNSLTKFGEFVIVRPDDIRKEKMESGDEFVSNSDVFNIAYDQLREKLIEGHNVIFDATNCRTNYRIRALHNTRDVAKKIFCLVSSRSLLDCLKENEAHNPAVPSDVVERMYFTLHKYPPHIYEGYDAIILF